MRTVLPSLAVSLAVALGGVAATDAAPPACKVPADAATVAAGGEVLVTVRQFLTSGGEQRSSYVACNRRDGSRTRLEDPAGLTTDVRLERIQVRGRYVSYVLARVQECSQCAPGTSTVRSVDTRSGRQRAIGPTGIDGADLVTALVSDRRGRIAWISAFADPQAPPPRPIRGRELRKFDARGPGRLSASPNLDPVSLRLEDARLGWSEGGRARSRVLR